MSIFSVGKKFFSAYKCINIYIGRWKKKTQKRRVKMQIGKIFKTIRELKKITLPEVANQLGIHHSSVGNFELYGHGLGPEKIAAYADLLGVSIVEDQVVFKKDMHIFYLPIIPGLRLTRLESFFDFLEVCKISPIQIVVFVEKKHAVSIAVKDLQNNVFIFLPRRGKYLAKTSALLQKLREKFSEKIINIIENPFSDFEKLKKTDLEKYFVGIYCYSCPQLVIQGPDGNIRCLPVVPIGAILEDLYYYLNHEKDPVRKEYTFLDFLHWTQKILQKSDEEIQADLEKARKIWKF